MPATCILMVLAGVGSGTHMQSMRKTGFRPFIVGLCAASLLAMVSLSLILFAGLV